MYDEKRMIVQISRTRLVKGLCSRQELEAMLFVAEHTSVGVPRIHRTYQRKNGLFIEMDFVPGDRLDVIWDGLSSLEKKAVVEEIWAQMLELRAVRVPDTMDIAVGSVSGENVRDGAISHNDVGPFRQLEDFDGLLRDKMAFAEFSFLWTKHRSSYPDDLHRTVLTHADLAPRNIIRSSNGSLFIIDWESAGWWPSYWEYVKWHFSDFPTLPGWLDLIDEVTGLGT